jgi:uncharacterized repeat protein (TIGR04076 family)
MGKAKDPDLGNKILATVIGVQGRCNAGHFQGDQFEWSVPNADGLCGFFSHNRFPRISAMQFGGKYPWWTDGQTVFEAECPDRKNLVTLRLEVQKR